MRAKITKQEEILNYIKSHSDEHGYPPTVREICAGVGLKSPSTVHGHIKRLMDKGLLEKSPLKTRALKVVETLSPPPSEYMEVPVLGRVAAGVPILAQQDIERTIPLPMDFARNGEVFMLRVSGDSMRDAGILNGDFVIVREQPTAENGEIVVAIIEEEATVKNFYRENGHFRLQPQNEFYEPIIVDSLDIAGKVIGIFRIL